MRTSVILNYILKFCSPHFRFLFVPKSDLFFWGKKNTLPAFSHKPWKNVSMYEVENKLFD